jgi:hypothetical protein
MPLTTEQVDNPIRVATIQFLEDQQLRGFNPEWMITFHYASPDERGWNISQRTPSTGNPLARSAPLMLNRPKSQGIARARNDFFEVSQDAQHIRNLLQRAIWGIKRHEKIDEQQTPMIFFHEKGGEEVQYHTHLLLGEMPVEFNTIESLEQVWKDHVIPKAQCLSRTNSVHIEFVEATTSAIGYLTKELQFRSEVVDYQASCLFRQPSPQELVRIHKKKVTEQYINRLLQEDEAEEEGLDATLLEENGACLIDLNRDGGQGEPVGIQTAPAVQAMPEGGVMDNPL